jgi:hypothetical protein
VPTAGTLLARKTIAPASGTGATSKHRIANSTMRRSDVFVATFVIFVIFVVQ